MRHAYSDPVISIVKAINAAQHKQLLLFPSNTRGLQPIATFHPEQFMRTSIPLSHVSSIILLVFLAGDALPKSDAEL